MEEKNSYMGWNPPPGGKNPNPRSDDGDNAPNNGENNQDDVWSRHKRRQSEGDDSMNDYLKKVGELFSNSGGGGFSKAKNSGSFKSLFIAVIVILLGIYIFMGFYTVREAERGVVLRFGKFYEVVDPGLQWKLSGIDKVFTVDIEQVRAIQSSGAMLTEDENVVIVEMDVQYRISDPVQYLFSVTNPDNSLTEATDSALRYVVGHTLMDDILTSGRERVRQDTRDLLNSIIEPYKMGLSIVDVNFLPARAPDEVKEAFDDAIAAQEDEQRFKREAEAYANEVLPRAEGRVQRIRQEAEAYRSQVVLEAQGHVARFEQILPEYNAAPEITRKRIYLETMQDVLAGSSKIILDTPEGSSPVLYLPMPNTSATNNSQQATPSAKSNLNSNNVSVANPYSIRSTNTSPYSSSTNASKSYSYGGSR